MFHHRVIGETLAPIYILSTHSHVGNRGFFILEDAYHLCYRLHRYCVSLYSETHLILHYYRFIFVIYFCDVFLLKSISLSGFGRFIILPTNHSILLIVRFFLTDSPQVQSRKKYSTEYETLIDQSDDPALIKLSVNNVLEDLFKIYSGYQVQYARRIQHHMLPPLSDYRFRHYLTNLYHIKIAGRQQVNATEFFYNEVRVLAPLLRFSFQDIIRKCDASMEAAFNQFKMTYKQDARIVSESDMCKQHCFI